MNDTIPVFLSQLYLHFKSKGPVKHTENIYGCLPSIPLSLKVDCFDHIRRLGVRSYINSSIRYYRITHVYNLVSYAKYVAQFVS